MLCEKKDFLTYIWQSYPLEGDNLTKLFQLRRVKLSMLTRISLITDSRATCLRVITSNTDQESKVICEKEGFLKRVLKKG